MGQGRRRTTLDESIDAALGEIAGAEVPAGLRAKVQRRLDVRATTERVTPRWNAPWLAAAAAAILVAAVLVSGLFVRTTPPGPPGGSTQVATGPGSTPPADSPVATQPAGRVEDRAGGEVGRAEAALADEPRRAASTDRAPVSRALLRATSLFRVWLLMPAPASRGADIAAALASGAETGEIEALYIAPISVAPIPPPDPVVIADIDIEPIVVAPIDIPVLQVKPLDEAEASSPRPVEKLRQ